MLKSIKLKTSTLLFIGLLVITVGIVLGFIEYFNGKKNRAFSEMSIKLYENENPGNVTKKTNIDEIKPTTSDSSQSIETNSYNYIGILEVPKINLKKGFLDINSKYNNVDYNVTIIKGSSFPDKEKNNLILAAHSGPCEYCYFDKLYKLKGDDQAYIFYNNIKYIYKIVNIYEVEKDGTVAIYRDYQKNCLTLITCTRNSLTKQTVYIFELVSQVSY